MNKQDRFNKFVAEHPNSKLVMRQLENDSKKKKQLVRDREKTFLAQYLFGLWNDGFTYREIALMATKVSHERVRQILMKFYPKEMVALKKQVLAKRKENNQKEAIERLPTYTCKQCSKTFKSIRASVFCNMDCFVAFKKANIFIPYPAWVNGRPIQKKYFTEWEWREINRVRTNYYYQRHRESMNKKAKEWRLKNEERFNLYKLRTIERKVYGKALTELPNPVNKSAVRP